MGSLSRLEYEIIEYTKCGKEEMSVLLGAFLGEYGLQKLLHALTRLVELDYLACYVGSSDQSIRVSKAQLEAYVHIRREAGEILHELPEVCEEYSFFATEQALEELTEEDRPV